MSNDVFANGREISCKKASGKSICSFPDVCFTPPDKVPPTPPGVPIPYPNTGMASDATKGSKKVKVSGAEVMLKNKSHFKKSMGDEAGCATKKGVVTSKNRGKIYFTMWSMDVKFEGKNVVRHLDMTTHNHGSMPSNTVPWLYTDTMDVSQIKGKECKKQADEFNKKCGKAFKDNKRPEGSPLGEFNNAGLKNDMCNEDKNPGCKEARKCIVMPYNIKCCDEDGKTQTPHHIVPKSQFTGPGGSPKLHPSYVAREAPCICAQGKSHSVGKHGEIHDHTNKLTREAVDVPSRKQIPSDKRWSVGEAEAVGAKATEEVTDCPAECTQQQVRAGHERMDVKASDQVRPTTAGGEPAQDDIGY